LSRRMKLPSAWAILSSSNRRVTRT
jgi:hypothetical protein